MGFFPLLCIMKHKTTKNQFVGRLAMTLLVATMAVVPTWAQTWTEVDSEEELTSTIAEGLTPASLRIASP